MIGHPCNLIAWVFFYTQLVMSALKVIKMGHPTLREVSKSIDEKKITSKDYQQFINDLIQTMRDCKGAGIAAPQVNVLDRVFVMEVTDNPRYPDKESFPLVVAINPEIEFVGDTKIDSWEGCLSIPNIRGRLQRHKKILLRGLDRTGQKFEQELQGFASIVAQHELDHLNGTLLIDRMPSMKTLTFQDEYDTYWKDL